jgi:hypothetical protein
MVGVEYKTKFIYIIGWELKWKHSTFKNNCTINLIIIIDKHLKIFKFFYDS